MEIIKIIKFYLLIFLLVILIKKIVSLPLKIGFDQFDFTFLIEFWKHKIYLKKNKTRDKYTNTFHKLFSIFFWKYYFNIIQTDPILVKLLTSLFQAKAHGRCSVVSHPLSSLTHCSLTKPQRSSCGLYIIPDSSLNILSPVISLSSLLSINVSDLTSPLSPSHSHYCPRQNAASQAILLTPINLLHIISSSQCHLRSALSHHRWPEEAPHICLHSLSS